jgi:NADP-dependent 3-hydroxy acid dehydrogenase YdfG
MHIFITGGTRGIGRGMVKEFIKKGHHVTYTGTTHNSVNESTLELKGDYLALVCDVRDYLLFEKTVEKAIEKHGNIDIFINNAGVDQLDDYIYKLPPEEIKKVIDINVIGTMYGVNIILKHMIKAKKGVVYNFEGLGSNNMVIPKTIVYGSSKRLIRYFSKAVNKEIKEYKNIHVGTIQPGMVFTDLLLHNMSEEGMKVARILGNEVEEVTSFIVKHILNGKKKVVFPTYRKAIRNLFRKNTRSV